MSFKQKIIRCRNLMSNEFKNPFGWYVFVPYIQVNTAKFFTGINLFYRYFEWFKLCQNLR